MHALIVDSHPIFRKGVGHVIENSFSFRTIHEAATANDALDIVLRESLSLAILDVQLPDRSGLTLLKQIKRLRPNLPCLMLTNHTERRYVELSLKFGASGYLTKASAVEELDQALRTIMSDKKYVTPVLVDQVSVAPHLGSTTLVTTPLSARELEVLTFMGKGLPVSQTAKRLGLSVKTVSTYRTRLLDKLRLKTTGDLIRYAVEHGDIR